MSHKKQGRKHHGIIPVIYSAGTAAFVFQEPCLEGTEEQNADDMTYRIDTAEKNHDSVIQDPGHIQSAENTVKNDPCQCYQYGCIIIRDEYFCIA